MEYQTDLIILERTELFRGVAVQALREIHAVSYRKRFSAGEIIFRQDDAAASLYVVSVGRLRATQTVPDGQQIIIRYLGPGEVAGYTTLSGAATHPGSITAVDDSYLIGWSADTIKQIMSEHTAIAMNAIVLLGARYREMQLRLRELSTERVEQRIAHTILRLTAQAGRRTVRGVEIAFPLTRQDLAEMSGTTLHTLSRPLSAWEEEGTVDCGRRRVIVAEMDALTLIAAGTSPRLPNRL
jgi:CRP-like cAMP-binding protein